MLRRIIHIDENKCNGCGLCASACQEGAIEIIAGKAKLIRDDYCDGLGNCLPVCPTEAISFEQREALAFDEKATERNNNIDKTEKSDNTSMCGCPGISSGIIEKTKQSAQSDILNQNISQLSQWPVQMKLAPVKAPYFDNADLLISADCCAYAYGNFHNKFIKNKITLIGCSKLDTPDYSDKLTAILENNDIKSIIVVRMEVPCCGGIVNALTTAMHNSGKIIPWQIVTISTDGKIIE